MATEQTSAKQRNVSRTPEERDRRKDIFVAVYAETGNLPAAALAAGHREKAVSSAIWRYRHDPELMARAEAARDQHVQDDIDRFKHQQERLRAGADEAITALLEVTRGEPKLPPDASRAERQIARRWSIGANARVMAAMAVLDRAGHKPVERIEQTVRWDEVSRELDGVNAATVFAVALAELGADPQADAPLLIEQKDQGHDAG